MNKKLSHYFMKLDEDFLQDPEVQLFIAERGKEAVFDYLGILLTMRDYQATDYMIPKRMIPVIAKLTLGTTPEKLEETINYCIGLGFFKEYRDEDLGVEYFYSERRQNDLRTWQITSSKRSEAGKKGNDKRWNNEKGEPDEAR